MAAQHLFESILPAKMTASLCLAACWVSGVTLTLTAIQSASLVALSTIIHIVQEVALVVPVALAVHQVTTPITVVITVVVTIYRSA